MKTATPIVDQPTLGREQIELALHALNQIGALLPFAQFQAHEGVDPEALLGMLGRIRQMNDAVMALLVDVVDGGKQSDELVQSKRLEILGRREVSHVS